MQFGPGAGFDPIRHCGTLRSFPTGMRQRGALHDDDSVSVSGLVAISGNAVLALSGRPCAERVSDTHFLSAQNGAHRPIAKLPQRSPPSRCIASVLLYPSRTSATSDHARLECIVNVVRVVNMFPDSRPRVRKMQQAREHRIGKNLHGFDFK
jgi:hypothetical protein